MRKHSLLLNVVIALLIMAEVGRPIPAMAFTPQSIITDEELSDASRMSEAEIQSFLESRQSGLAKLVIGGKRASAIIFTAARKFSINPQVLLVILQKEQSLLEAKRPTTKQLQWATGYGVCDSCRLNDPAVARWRGFETQVNAAAEFFRKFLDEPSRLFVKVGSPILIDEVAIVPANIATATLYSYTPHLHGNQVFWGLYTRLFVRQYPDGSLVKSPTQAIVWYLQQGVRRPIRSMAVLKSRFTSQPILTSATQSELEKYPIGPAIGLANYSLIRLPDGMIALIDGDEYRPIESIEVFRLIGYNPEEVEPIDPGALQGYQRGEMITQKSIFPTGIILEEIGTRELFYIEDGIKHPVLDRTLLALRFPNRSASPGDSATIASYPIGDPILVPDGSLVKSPDSPTVYIITDRKRRRIPSELAFKTLGYSWKSIVTISPTLLALHPDNGTLDVATPDIPTSDTRPQFRGR